jgi:SHS2 domain-containing protein
LSKPPKYQLLEHTADLRLKVKGRNLRLLFSNAALAMFDIIAEEKKTGKAPSQKIKITQDAADLEELFINWLNELLSLSSAKGLIFNSFNILKLTPNSLEAIVCGRNISNYKVNVEVKAATYHRLELERSTSGWQAQLVFDV